jgi:signal transduction histidine kinase
MSSPVPTGDEAQFAARLEAEKLAALAEFAAGAGHEINNPLAVISGRAQLLLADEPDPERRRELSVIHRQALRIHEMISDLMHFARPAQPQFALVAVDELLADVVKRLATRAAEIGARITIDTPAGALALWGDRNQLAVALSVVIENAIDALSAVANHRESVTENPEEIRICARRDAEAGQSGAVTITVSDRGAGFDATTRRHLFDPFYSGRSAGRRLGMGLAKCWRIVTLHGGSIEVDDQHDQRTVFSLVLPLYSANATNPGHSTNGRNGADGSALS